MSPTSNYIKCQPAGERLSRSRRRQLTELDIKMRTCIWCRRTYEEVSTATACEKWYEEHNLIDYQTRLDNKRNYRKEGK